MFYARQQARENEDDLITLVVNVMFSSSHYHPNEQNVIRTIDECIEYLKIRLSMEDDFLHVVFVCEGTHYYRFFTIETEIWYDNMM